MLIKNLHLPITALLFSLLVSLASGCGKDTTDSAAQTEATRDQSATHQKVGESIAGEKPDIVAGKIVYEKHCHYCHGKKGRGKGAVSIAIEPNPADFISDKKRMAVTDEALYKSLSHGISKESGGQKLEKAMAMPPFMGVLTPKERWDVIAYIRELVRVSKNEVKKN